MATPRIGATGVGTTKGDLYVVNASGELERVPVGTDTYALTADSAQPLGLKWANPNAPVDGDAYVQVNGVWVNTAWYPKRVFNPVNEPNSSIVTTAARAYAAYLGFLPVAQTIKFVETNVALSGLGAQTAEFALGSTPLPPNKSAQTVTILVADDTIDTLAAGTGLKRNTTAFNAGAGYVVAAYTHLWAVIRVSMVTTQPTFNGLIGALGKGQILTLSAAAVLAAGNTLVGMTNATSVTTVVAPNMWATSD